MLVGSREQKTRRGKRGHRVTDHPGTGSFLVTNQVVKLTTRTRFRTLDRQDVPPLCLLHLTPAVVLNLLLPKVEGSMAEILRF